MILLIFFLNGNTTIDDGNDEDDKEEGAEDNEEEEEEEYNSNFDSDDDDDDDDDDDTSVDDKDDDKITQEEDDNDDDNSNEEEDEDRDDDDFVPPKTIKKFFPGYGWFVGTVTKTTINNRKYYCVIYADDNEVCTESDLKILMMKQNIQIGESGYKFIREYEGMFYSGLFKDKNELGMQICNLNYGKVQECNLKTLKEWKDLMNLDKCKAFKGSL